MIVEEFFAIVAAVDSAPEAMPDDDFGELVTKRNDTARALAATPASDHAEIEAKMRALALISSKREAGSYGDSTDLLMKQSIDRDLARLAC
jgi:hypothetical protein